MPTFLPQREQTRWWRASRVALVLAWAAWAPGRAAAADIPPTSAATTYTVTNLGVAGGDASEANAINAQGQIVGWIDIADGATHHAFLYRDGQMQDLGHLGGYEANAINAAGQVVGVNTYSHAFLYAQGKMQDLGTLGGTESGAYAINDDGLIVGRSQIKFAPGIDKAGVSTRNELRHAFLYDHGTMRDLGESSDGATAINNLGEIVGTVSFKSSAPPRSNYVTKHDEAARFSAGQTPALSPPPSAQTGPLVTQPGRPLIELMGQGSLANHESVAVLGGEGFGSAANAINNSGQIVGVATVPLPKNGGAIAHAFLFTQGELQDLDPLSKKLSSAWAINSSGQIVGWMADGHQRTNLGDSPVNQRAFLYTQGQLLDLNDCVGPAALAAAGFKTLLFAKGINDRRQIVGYGEDVNGKHRAFLLTPKSGQDADAFSADAKPAVSAPAAPAPVAPPTPLTQFMVEWRAPGLATPVRLPAMLKEPAIFDAAPGRGQFRLATFDENKYLHMDPYPGRTLNHGGTLNNLKTYILINCPSLNFGLRVDPADRLTAQVATYLPAPNAAPLNVSFPVNPKDMGSSTTTSVNGTAVEWAQGRPVGVTTLKITSKTIILNDPADKPEPAKAVWFLLAARQGTPPSGVKSAPDSVLKQAAEILGFKPVILDAKIAEAKKPDVSQTRWARVQYTVTPLETQSAFTVQLRFLAPLYLEFPPHLSEKPASYKEIFYTVGAGFANAPIVAGPLGVGEEEVYAVFAAEPPAEPTAAPSASATAAQ